MLMLMLPEVSVITFASFVVISQHTLAANNISETIFERMIRRLARLRNSPQSHLCKGRTLCMGNDSCHSGRCN